MGARRNRRKRKTHKRALMEKLFEALKPCLDLSVDDISTPWLRTRYFYPNTPTAVQSQYDGVAILHRRGLDLKIEDAHRSQRGALNRPYSAKYVNVQFLQTPDTIEIREPIALFPSETLIAQLTLLL